MPVPLDHVVSHFYHNISWLSAMLSVEMMLMGVMRANGLLIMLIVCYCRLAALCLSNMLDGVLGGIRKFSIAKGIMACIYCAFILIEQSVCPLLVVCVR